jgi:RHS repeat-associated protein
MDGLGHVIQTQLNTPDALGPINVKTTYDGLGRVYTVSNPYQSTSDLSYGLTTYTYDSLGRKTIQTQPDNTSSSPSILQWCYNGVPSSGQTNCTANKSTLTNAPWVDYSDETGRHWQRVSDGLGRLVAVMEPDGSTTTPNTSFIETDYAYNALDNLLTVNQHGLTRTFTYDSLSRLLTATNPETGTVCYGVYNASNCVNGYDANSNLIAKTDARGITTSYHYDTLNRMTEQDSSDTGTPTYFWQYDSSSVNRTSIINPIGHVVYSGTAFNYGGSSPQLLTTTTNTKFDAMGRIWNQQVCTLLACHGNIPPYSLAFTYDLAGNQTSYSPDPQLVINQAYDSASRLSSVTSTNTFGYGANIWTADNYGPVGLHVATFGNGVDEVLQYDNRLRLSSTYVCGSPCSRPFIYSTSLAFYANGTISFNNDSINGSLYFGYDNLNRLLAVRPKAGPYNGMDLNEIYDSFGNRNQSMYVGGVLQPGASYSFTSANQISGFCYDAAGDLQDYGLCPQNGSAHLYSYYGDGKLKSPDSGITTYIYDAEGRRVIESTSSSSSNSFDYLYNTNGTTMAIASYPQQPTAVHWLNFPVYGADGRQRAIFGAGTIHFDHVDWLHTLRVQTDASGAIFQTFTNFPFGDNMLTGNPGAQFTGKEFHFTGKERDAESGLDYFGARYYASTIGRFASADPYEIVLRKNQGKSANEQKQLLDSFIANPQAWNKYAYGLNNPLKNIDIGGNCSAPAGLRGGQTGVCVEAFIAAPRIGGVGLGDNRGFNPNGGTYRFRVDVRVDQGANGGVSVNKDLGVSKVGTESVNVGIRGSGDVTLGPVTTDADGNRHFEVTGAAQNGFEAVNNLGTISFDLKFTATPDGTVTLDKAMGTTFPSMEAYTYNSSGQLTGTLLQAPERQSGDLKKPQQCIGGSQCPQ